MVFGQGRAVAAARQLFAGIDYRGGSRGFRAGRYSVFGADETPQRAPQRKPSTPRWGVPPPRAAILDRDQGRLTPTSGLIAFAALHGVPATDWLSIAVLAGAPGLHLLFRSCRYRHVCHAPDGRLEERYGLSSRNTDPAESVRGPYTADGGRERRFGASPTQQSYDGAASRHRLMPRVRQRPRGGQGGGVAVRVERVRPPTSTVPIKKIRLAGARAGSMRSRRYVVT